MAPMKIYSLIVAAAPIPFFGFIIALAWLQRDRAALLAQGLPTADIEAAIASAGIGAVVSFAAAALITAVIAVALRKFGDGEADDTPKFGLAA
jgi:hypothetical protein